MNGRSVPWFRGVIGIWDRGRGGCLMWLLRNTEIATNTHTNRLAVGDRDTDTIIHTHTWVSKQECIIIQVRIWWTQLKVFNGLHGSEVDKDPGFEYRPCKHLHTHKHTDARTNWNIISLTAKQCECERETVGVPLFYTKTLENLT